MKKITIFSFLLAIGFSISAVGQTVGRRPPKVVLKDYNLKEDDGKLEFEVDVRMADCISYVEIRKTGSRKSLQLPVSEDNYHLSEENGQDILLRLSLGTLKELLKKSESINAGLTIYSKSGKPIYTNELSLNKQDLISSGGDWK